MFVLLRCKLKAKADLEKFGKAQEKNIYLSIGSVLDNEISELDGLVFLSP